jgi:hypothetical protein
MLRLRSPLRRKCVFYGRIASLRQLVEVEE